MSMEHLLRLTEEKCISFKKKEVSMSLFLDAEAAFDKAWHDAIRYKLHKTYKVPNRLTRLISSFLSGRRLFVNVENATSREIIMLAGTPQGSALSPLLYLILVNDMPESITKYASLSQFADDTGLWTSAYTFQGCLSKLQKAVNELETWCRKWRMKLNGSKSNLMVSTKLRESPSEDVSIQIFNDIVRPVTSAKFLGVTYDENMSMNEHVDNAIKKAMSRLGVFKLLSFGGVKNETLIKLYKIYVRPLFEYGSISFIHIPREIERAQKVQNVFIRTALKLPSYLSTELLHTAANLEMMKDRLISLNNKLLAKMMRSETVKDLSAKYENTIPLNRYQSPFDVLTRPSA